MGKRTRKTTTAKLTIKKETLRALLVRTLDADQLQQVAGGYPTGGCGGNEAPSHCRC
jgi:hypothetical protein